MWAFKLLILFWLRNRFWILQLRTMKSSVQNDALDGRQWIQGPWVLSDSSNSKYFKISLRTLFADNWSFCAKRSEVAESNCHFTHSKTKSQNLLQNRWWILQLRTKMSSMQNDTMDGWQCIKEHSVLSDSSTSQKIQIFTSTLIAHPVILREAKLSRRIYWITNYKFFAKWNGIAESNCHTAWNEMESQNLLKNRWWILQLRAKMSSVQNDMMDGSQWI